MRLMNIILATALSLTGGCSQLNSSKNTAFEIHDFSTKEKTTDATSYSKVWNEFNSTGTLVANNTPAGQAMIVTLEAKDTSDSPNPDPQYVSVLVRHGTGRIEVRKSNYGEMSKRPIYQWSVVGWIPMENGVIKATP
jgi:hypothetical protein